MVWAKIQIDENEPGWKWEKKDSFWRKLYEMLHWLDYPKDSFASLSICLKSSVDVLVHVIYFYLVYPALEIVSIAE